MKNIFRNLPKYIFVILFYMVIVGVGKANAVGCGGSWKCVGFDINFNCNSTVIRSGSCGGPDAASCLASDPGCSSDQCDLGGCYWEDPNGGTQTTSCPSECKLGSSCGPGFVGASGCDGTGPNFGCASNKACCAATSCPAPSLDGCPAGQQRIPDPAFAPNYVVCKTSACEFPDRDDSFECSPSKTGQYRGACYNMICACVNNPPGVPTLLSPADEANTSTTLVNLQWSVSDWGKNCAGNTNNTTTLYLEPCPATGPIVDPTTQVYSLQAPSGYTSYLANYNLNGTIGTSYCWRALAANGAATSAYTATRRFHLAGGITGTVYNDVNANCTGSGSNLGAAGMQVTWGSDTATVQADGTFSLTPSGSTNQNLTLTGVPAGYICTPTSAGCNADGCTVKTSVASNSTNRNYYLTQSRAAWWQAVGAGVYAGATSSESIKSILPSATTSLIIPGTNSLAALVKASSTQPSLNGGLINANGWSAVSQYKGDRMDYPFWAAHMGLTSTATDDMAGSVLTKPVNTPSKNFWYQNGNATISSNWAVANGESYVIFVNGNLQIDANITVASGGFLAFIVNGGVTVGTSATARSVQGLYVMDDMFTTAAGAGQVAVEGTIVTWTGLNLQRDLGATNVNTPAERFSYRADLLTNMPEAMKVFALRWQEVAPGTFDNQIN